MRRLAILASLALHGLLLLVVIEGRLPEVPRRPSVVLLPLPEPDQERASPMPYYVPRLEQGGGRRPRLRPPPNPLPADTARPVAPPASEPAPREAPARLPPSLRPSLGDGRLWVRPLPLPPRDLARRLARTHEELVDSAVKAIVQAYLDSIANEPGAGQVRMPEWVTEVDGKKFGLDGKNIYIAGLKIPAAVLALLPLPSGGNQQTALDHNGQVIMDDLQRAALRSTNLAEFKEAIRRLREEKQREKDFERAQRERPDTAASPRPGSDQP
ncbi:MAG TPA: hypothetical protein VNJ71_00305 [Gemmatimonadales bacterium]|jgi:hypothetical protein|nr:hypothetical protein [Gemmatimonadales bacterium]